MSSATEFVLHNLRCKQTPQAIVEYTSPAIIDVLGMICNSEEKAHGSGSVEYQRAVVELLKEYRKQAKEKLNRK